MCLVDGDRNALGLAVGYGIDGKRSQFSAVGQQSQSGELRNRTK